MTRRLLLPIAALLLACRAEVPRGEPIRPGLAAGETRRDRPFSLRYSWTVGDGASRLGPDTRAFVHFRANGRLVFADDHVPVPPPSEWEPGQTYRYTRTRFVPAPEGAPELEVRMGLYSPRANRRIPLLEAHTKAHEYNVGRVTLGPAPVDLPIVYREGWYVADRNPDGVIRTWTAREARATFRSPRADAIVYVEAETTFEAFASPPSLTVSVGEYQVTVPIESGAVAVRGFRFPAAALGGGRSTDLWLTLSESFVPRDRGENADHRALGLFVNHLSVVPASEPVPPELAIADAAPLP
jgi:hypothetical protein